MADVKKKMTTIPTIKISALETIVSNVIKQNSIVPLIIHGPSGIGKTAIITDATRKHNAVLHENRIGLLESPAEIRLPVIETSKSQFTYQSSPLLPVYVEDDERTHVLFLDEMNMAPPSIMGVLQQMLETRFGDQRFIGNIRMPRNLVVIASVNDAEHTFTVQEIPPTVNNRVVHINVEPDRSREYLESLLILKGLKFHPTVSTFLLSNPDCIYDDSSSQEESLWPSYRSWKSASEMIRVIGEDSIELAIQSSVGKPMASRFMDWLSDKRRHILNLQSISEQGWKSKEALSDSIEIEAFQTYYLLAQWEPKDQPKTVDEAANIAAFFGHNRTYEKYVAMCYMLSNKMQNDQEISGNTNRPTLANLLVPGSFMSKDINSSELFISGAANPEEILKAANLEMGYHNWYTQIHTARKLVNKFWSPKMVSDYKNR